MTSKTWVELINHYYLPPIDKHFSSDNLLSGIQRTKWFVDIIETTKVIDEELSLNRNTCRPKKKESSSAAFMLLVKERYLGCRMFQ